MSGEKGDWHRLPHLPGAAWQTSYLCATATGDKKPASLADKHPVNPVLRGRRADPTAPHINTYPHPFTGSLLAKHISTSPPNPPCPKL